MPGTAFLRGHGNDACHRARTIYRGGRAVLQDFERLDIVGVQACDGRRDQRIGIARGQVVGRDVDDVLEDDAVDHPQGLRRAIDARGTAHADLGRCAERATDVLDGDTGSPTLQRTADVGHTVDLRVGSIDLGRRAGERALVDLLHTRDHHLVDHHCLVGLQHDAHAIPRRKGLRRHAYIAEDELLALRHFDCEVAIDVSSCSILAALHLYRRTDGRLAVSFDDGSCNLRLCKGYTHNKQQKYP